MPRKIIPLGSPQFEYDFSHNYSPFENGVGYAIAQWMGLPERKAAVAQESQKLEHQDAVEARHRDLTDMQMANMADQMQHRGDPKGANGPGQLAPDHIIRELTTKLEGTPSLTYDANGNPVTQYRRAPLDPKEAIRKLVEAGINPKTLRFDPNATMPLDEEPPPAPPPAPAAPPAPPKREPGFFENLGRGIGDFAMHHLTPDFSRNGADAAPAPAPAAPAPPAAGGGGIAHALDRGIGHLFDSEPGAVQGEEFSMGEPVPEPAQAPTTDPRLAAQAHAALVADLTRGGLPQEQAAQVAQVVAEGQADQVRSLLAQNPGLRDAVRRYLAALTGGG